MIYKLLKWYPSLPKNWKVGMEVGMGDRKTTFSPCSLNYTERYIDINEVTKNPEYWEEMTVDVTHDGEVLNIGDNFYIVKIDDVNHGIIKSIFTKGCSSERAKVYGNLWFSTKENAEDYIENKKIQYNKKDMISFAKFVHLKHAGTIGITYNIDMLYKEYIIECNKEK